jgi:N-acylneuraminate cytidylyltransferase/CMP-N,N'-diacetyllegionaminic acid synthase
MKRKERLNIVAVIPARGGSKSVPGKNIKKLAGKPLIAHTIEDALKAKTLNRVIVSTNDEKIAKISKQYGAEVPFKRPAYLATDTAHTPPVIKHAVKYLEEKEGSKVDVVVTLQPTSPLRKPEDIDAAVNKLIRTNADCVVTICEVEYPPFWMKILQGDKIIPFVKTKIDYHLLERQQLPKVYKLNGAVFVTKRDILMKKNKLIGGDVRAIKMDTKRSLDINSLMDFMLAENLMKKN